jgi:thioredoxin reductase (NADPH)
MMPRCPTADPNGRRAKLPTGWQSPQVSRSGLEPHNLPFRGTYSLRASLGGVISNDCIIVGGGPAGLTAAIYLARFLLRVTVFDGGQSRAASIPCTHNHAGYPGGIAGKELLARMREQATAYGARIVEASVSALRRDGDNFIATTGNGELVAKSVLLATGVVNNRPEMSEAIHDEALARGLLRYCPICDGYEVRDRNIAVLGSGVRGADEALFLRSYSADITLVTPDGDDGLDGKCRQSLAAAGVRIVQGPVARFAIGDSAIALTVAGKVLSFDTLYPALGSVIRSELAAELGVQLSDEGCPMVDAHQRTSVAGLYAAGDVVLGLDQISNAMGQGGIAATTIRNDLAETAPLYRAAPAAASQPVFEHQTQSVEGQ